LTKPGTLAVGSDAGRHVLRDARRTAAARRQACAIRGLLVDVAQLEPGSPGIWLKLPWRADGNRDSPSGSTSCSSASMRTTNRDHRQHALNVDALSHIREQPRARKCDRFGAALAERAFSVQPQPARLFLMSDGASTWKNEPTRHASSTERLAVRLPDRPAGTDASCSPRPRHGAVFSVTGESEIARAATAHRARPWRLLGVAVTGATDVLVAGNPTALFPGQTVLVAGRGQLAAGAELSLTLEQDGRRET
jgi:hypothetical protein